MRGPHRLLENMRHIVRTILQRQRATPESVKLLRQIRTQLVEIRVQTRFGRATPQAGLLGTVIAADGRYADPLCLGRNHAQVYSQSGEDGIIAEIFSRIGTRDRFFIEIGVGDGRENNTRFLLEQGWRGIWLEGSVQAAADASRIFAEPVRDGQLVIVSDQVTVSNVNQVLDNVHAPDMCDFISVDIDFNTPHVWNAMRHRARVACVEYNPSIPPSLDLSVPYDPLGEWDGTNWYGGSLKALERIGAGKGLALVGCDLLGSDAFFVSVAEARGRFREPFSAEHHYEPPRFELLSHVGHWPSSVARSWRSGSP